MNGDAREEEAMNLLCGLLGFMNLGQASVEPSAPFLRQSTGDLEGWAEGGKMVTISTPLLAPKLCKVKSGKAG